MRKLELEDGAHVYVNPDHVLIIEEDFDGITTITLSDGTVVAPSGTIDEVARHLE